MAEDRTRKRLSTIKSGGFARGFALAKVSMSAGAKAASHAMGNLFASEEERPERLKALLLSQIELLTRELGQLKGSVMKVGQMLSMVGEDVLPPEVMKVLKSLQSESPPLEWEAIERVLKRQLGDERLARLEIDTEPSGSASLGQVHRARIRETGREIALKVQYPGVDQAIESDINALKRIFSFSKLVPKGHNYDHVFKEVRQMLHQEVDYCKELEATREFRELLKGDPRLIVPEVFEEFSTSRVLATSWEPGIPVDGPEVRALSQERRNALGLAALELYFRELFEFRKVQTDPHFGNYRVRLAPKEGEPDQLVLFDFGAVRKFSRKFLDPYFEMLHGTFYHDQERIERGAEGLDFLRPEDSEKQRQAFAQVCYLFLEPFEDEIFDWGSSDLPMRAKRAGAELALSFRLRPPPREVVFLDRKMAGVFFFLKALGAKLNARPLLEKYMRMVA